MGKAVCLVTGSSRGIGRSTVLEMAKSGLDVIINYYHPLMFQTEAPLFAIYPFLYLLYQDTSS